MPMDDIVRPFYWKGTIRGGQYLFDTDDSIAIIERCRERDKKILGIDAFKDYGSQIEMMDYVYYEGKGYDNFDPAKYFDKYHIKKNSDAGHWQEATQFIRDRKDQGRVFEIVYD